MEEEIIPTTINHNEDYEQDGPDHNIRVKSSGNSKKGGPKKRLIIKSIKLYNFKSYQGEHIIGPLNTVYPPLDSKLKKLEFYSCYRSQWQWQVKSAGSFGVCVW